jgi:hypothetical protein
MTLDAIHDALCDCERCVYATLAHQERLDRPESALDLRHAIEVIEEMLIAGDVDGARAYCAEVLRG